MERFTPPTAPPTCYESVIASLAGRLAIDWLVARLTRKAAGPLKKGIRLEILQHASQRGKEGAEKAKDLASRLGLSESRISNAVDEIKREIEEFLKSELPKQVLRTLP